MSPLGGQPSREKAKAVYSWLSAAQRAHDSGGVAARYDVLKRSWQQPYPETTGYIIPTVQVVGQLLDSPNDRRQRVLNMALYLANLQRADGSIECSRFPSESQPVTVAFDLGAILNGLISAGHVDENYLQVADRLTSFLVRSQDNNGSWSKEMNYFDSSDSHNSLVGYALLRASAALNRSDARNSGLQTLENLFPKIDKSGFVTSCGFGEDNRTSAFIHPVCYSLEGFLKTNLLLGQEAFPVGQSLLRLAEYASHRYKIPARFDEHFNPTTWFGVGTGYAQLSLILGFSADAQCKLLGAEILQRLDRKINANAKNPGVRGGVPSSIPLFGGYGRWTYNNWGAKYYLDSWMMHSEGVLVP